MCRDLIGELAAAYSKGSVGLKSRDTAMQQIADWLKKLALGQYAQTFAENGIGVSVLHYLTDQDLKKIGVLLGHRRKILRGDRLNLEGAQ